ncbi:MAG TPA: heparinase II/III-family protein, partial [Pyrinomonadaceae bacterium]|nr:heparinase II/III-family protein [Pyrinomonadaceae bacterium]
HAYLVALGAVFFGEARFKTTGKVPEEVLWLLGEGGARAYAAMPVAAAEANESRAFKDAGTYVMRAGDAYLLFNASGAGLKGRGSHGHNDALSFEVAACGAVFVRDPGTYVYTRDFAERHLFRSTAYHSTVEVDGAEQNTTDPRAPFRICDEARPRVLKWESDEARDFVVAEHGGYARASLRRAGGVTHRRSVLFDKREGVWLVEDELAGEGEHTFRFVFHLAPGTDARVRSETGVEVCDRITGARLFIESHIESDGARARPTLEPRWSSREYGEKTRSQAACWTVRARAPLVARWALVPVGAGEGVEERLKDFGFRISDFGLFE